MLVKGTTEARLGLPAVAGVLAPLGEAVPFGLARRSNADFLYTAGKVVNWAVLILEPHNIVGCTVLTMRQVSQVLYTMLNCTANVHRTQGSMNYNFV